MPDSRLTGPPAALLLAVAGLALGFGLSGCDLFGGGDDACVVGTPGCSCTTAGACEAGLVCAAGRCVTGDGGCNPACPAGSTCASGRCVTMETPDMSVAGRGIGAPCTQHSDCGAGICLTSKGDPEGYCSKICGGQVLLQQACPTGASCVQVNEASSLCLDRCGSGDGDCRSGYVCQTAQESSVCLSRCQSDDDCDAASTCSLDSGRCEPRPAPRPGRVGEPCQADVNCASGLCMTEAATMGGFKGGYCIASCTAAEDGKPCDDGRGACVGLPRSDGTKLYVCMGACAVGVDCRPEYTCSADFKQRMLTSAGVCLPRCEHFMCAAGTTCDPSVGICTPNGESSNGPAVTVQDLGTVPVGEDFSGAPLQFDVSPDAVSVSLVADAADDSGLIVFGKITAPNGRVIFDIQNPVNNVIRWSPLWAGSAVMVLPNTPRVIPTPGRYSLTLAAEMATQAKVTLVQKRQGGVVEGGSLPVVFWFARNQILDAQKARTDPTFQKAMAEFAAIYASVGIKVGPVSYLDITGTDGQSFGSIESMDELARLFAVANRSTEKAMHFFAVDEISLGEGGTGVLLGISGGLPGAPSLPEVRRSGVAVALAFMDEPQFPDTIAHEGGHFLGLYHLSEREGTSHDPLIDTPECPATADRNGNKLIDVNECAGKGADNLMFWSSGRARQTLVSKDQRFVMLRNPMVQ